MASSGQRMMLDAVEQLARNALAASNVSSDNAAIMARSVRAAEADGLRSHGLARLPAYCDHARIGKVDGHAVPDVRQTAASAILADARCGFAHPAIERGLEQLVKRARETGIAVLAVTNSYNCGVVGHHVEAVARSGHVALGFVNTPPAIAPWGGRKPLLGTNPIAFAMPRAGEPPLIIDQSSSVVARGEVLVHAQTGKPIPEGWAVDRDGHPTRDAKAAMDGSLLPAGGHKGAALALMIELLAAALGGANLGMDASSFADNVGPPPRTGQSFIAIDPSHLAGSDVAAARTERLLAAMLSQSGVRLPGTRRLANRDRISRDGVEVPDTLLEKINAAIAGRS